MKLSIVEFLACVFALGGALAVGFVLFPLLNPIQYRVAILGGNVRGNELASLFHYLISVPVAVVLLWSAFRFNREAARIKLEENKASTPSIGN